MIEEMVRKEFVEQGPISSTLYLFGVTANDILIALEQDLGMMLRIADL